VQRDNIDSQTNKLQMAKYAGQGDTALTLAEECAEVIQIITKMKRFGGNWDEIPPSKDKTRWEMLEEEMNDLLLAWDALKNERP
jgi:NTP pyrophosphatase (non-canonical NTP hydrolase)